MRHPEPHVLRVHLLELFAEANDLCAILGRRHSVRSLVDVSVQVVGEGATDVALVILAYPRILIVHSAACEPIGFLD